MRKGRSVLGVLVVIAAVAWGAQLAGGTERDPKVADTTQGRVSAESEVMAPTPGALTSPTASKPSRAVLDEVQQAAVAGVTAWQDRNAAARNAALALIATPDYAAALKGVDPAAVPECTPDQVRTAVETDGLARITVTCHTGLVLQVDLTLEHADWRVEDIAPGT